MDGYIKNKNIAIRSVRKTIFYKYAYALLIVLFIPVMLFAIAVNQPPEKWTHTDIVFSHISYERIEMRKHNDYVLNTRSNDQFVMQMPDKSVEEISEHLISGKLYSVVYSNSIAGGDILEALSDKDGVYLDLDNSIAEWKKEQKTYTIVIVIFLIIEIIVLIIIDRVACKNDHYQIKKLKEDIERRKKRMNKI